MRDNKLLAVLFSCGTRRSGFVGGRHWHLVIHRPLGTFCQVRKGTVRQKISIGPWFLSRINRSEDNSGNSPATSSLVSAVLLLSSASSSFRSLSMRVFLGFVAGGLLLILLAFLASADWLRLAATRRLANDAAAAAALAAAKNPDAMDAAAFGAARAMAGGAEITVFAERGSARPGPSGLVFAVGSGEVTRVAVSMTARSLLGTPIGLGQRTVTASAMAARSGVAALTERTTAVPDLPTVPAAIEAQLFGPNGSLTANERSMLGRTVFRVADLVAELSRTLSARDGGVDVGVAAVAGASFKPSELLSALGALYRGSARTSAATADVLAIIDRLAGVGTAEETALPFAGVISLGGSDADLTLAAPIRPLEFVQAVMRARLAQGAVALELKSPVTGINAVALTLKSESAAAAVLIGGEDGLVGIPAIRITARFIISGLAIPGTDTLELPLEVTLGSGDARIRRISCGAAGPEITVIGRPVRASVALAVEESASPAGASDYVRLLAGDGLTAWGKGRSSFADDPPVELVFRPGTGDTVASLRTAIDFSNRLERLATETQILVSLEGSAKGMMSEGGVRNEIARLIVGSVGPVDAVLSSVFATFGIVPGKMDVVAAGAACNTATLLGEAK
ncbi:MAG: hypothetical protein H6R00_878 [Proteobacteria bacterium]|nr:hypothetical protein [Pseudomonadota bacterium]